MPHIPKLSDMLNALSSNKPATQPTGSNNTGATTDMPQNKHVTQQQLQASALQQLAIIGGQLTKDDEIKFEGTSFVFPQRYQGNLTGLAEDVVRYAQSMGEIVVVKKTFPYRVNDGAYATRECLKRFFGYAQSKATPTAFGPKPPEEMTIDLGYVNGQMVRETVPWGDMVLPGLPESTLRLGMEMTNRGMLFNLSAKVRKVEKVIIDGFYKAVEDYLEQNSIYRGKAIDGGMNFVDVDRIHPEDFVYSQEVWANAETNFLSPLRDHKEIAAQGLSKKRVTLLEGPFGTGKTGLLRTAMKVAVAAGATAIACRPGEDDPLDVLQTAILYAGDTGAFVAIEDIDVIAANRDPQMVSKILDTFDGPQTKNLPITVVMTTNHPEKIHKGMLRSGRIDAVMHIGEMDRPGVEKLAHHVLQKHLVDDVDFDKVFEATSGFMPAYVKEGLERALRFTISRTGKAGNVNTDDLVFALNSLRAQYDLQERATDKTRELPPLDMVFRELVADQFESLNVVDQVDNIIENRMNGARIALEDANGDEINGQIATN